MLIAKKRRRYVQLARKRGRRRRAADLAAVGRRLDRASRRLLVLSPPAGSRYRICVTNRSTHFVIYEQKNSDQNIRVYLRFYNL